MTRYSDAKAMERELDEFRSGAAERGGAMVLWRHDEPNGEVGLEPVFVGAQRQEDGLMALKFLAGDEMRLELLGYENDLKRMLAEPVDWSQPGPL
jgi:hypothetical protein